MGIYDRPYYREETTRRLGDMSAWSVNTWIIAINVAVFLLNNVLIPPVDVELPGGFIQRSRLLTEWGEFSVGTAIYGAQVWRFITFQFLHAGVMHILFNMLGLYFFGGIVEQMLGPRRYLLFYLLSGVGGAVGFIFLCGLLGFSVMSPLVGASAGCFGVLVAAALFVPNAQTMFMIFPIMVPMKMRTLAWLMIGLATVNLVTGGENAGGDAAHLGGTVAGYLMLKYPLLIDWLAGFSLPTLRSLKRFRPGRPRMRVYVEPPEVEDEDDLRDQVDRILAKIHERGSESLTPRERETLERASRRLRRPGSRR